MKVITTGLSEVLIFEPTVFTDERGFFFESFNQNTFNSIVNAPVSFMQDNHSRSALGVLRGLHYQVKHPQGKLVRVIAGAVFDVAVDIRKNSANFGKWFGVELSEKNKRQLWIPPGFAHGFLVLTDVADVLYKTTQFYMPHEERCISWNDPVLKINWPLNGTPSISKKDKEGIDFLNIETL